MATGRPRCRASPMSRMNRILSHVTLSAETGAVVASSSGTPLVLYHMPGARSTRVLWMYYELRAVLPKGTLPDLRVKTFKSWDSFRSNKPKWYLKLNPNGKVPTLVHGDVVVWESVACCLYLLETFDKERRLRAPEGDSSAAAKFFTLCMYSSGTIDNLTATSSPIQRVMGTTRPNRDKYATNRRAWNIVAGPIMVRALGRGPYLFGNNFSALDVIVGLNLMYVDSKKGWLDTEAFPELAAYWRRLRARPAFRMATGCSDPTELFAGR